jgi:genome maintenance exonuclease 1
MKKFNHVGTTLTELTTENIDGKRHYVTPNGSYISITTLLANLSKDGIQKWRNRVGATEANRISTKASRQGNAIHALCEKYIKNEEGFLTESMPHLVEMFESILPLLDRVDNVHVTEGAMYSDELGLAGRTDLIAEFDEQLAIIDYKTSRRIKTWEMCASYFMQGAFYAHAYEERTGIPINNIVIIMAVENEKPLLFRETKERWLNPLKEVQYKYM